MQRSWNILHAHLYTYNLLCSVFALTYPSACTHACILISIFFAWIHQRIYVLVHCLQCIADRTCVSKYFRCFFICSASPPNTHHSHLRRPGRLCSALVKEDMVNQSLSQTGRQTLLANKLQSKFQGSMYCYYHLRLLGGIFYAPLLSLLFLLTSFWFSGWWNALSRITVTGFSASQDRLAKTGHLAFIARRNLQYSGWTKNKRIVPTIYDISSAENDLNPSRSFSDQLGICFQFKKKTAFPWLVLSPLTLVEVSFLFLLIGLAIGSGDRRGVESAEKVSHVYIMPLLFSKLFEGQIHLCIRC